MKPTLNLAILALLASLTSISGHAFDDGTPPPQGVITVGEMGSEQIEQNAAWVRSGFNALALRGFGLTACGISSDQQIKVCIAYRPNEFYSGTESYFIVQDSPRAAAKLFSFRYYNFRHGTAYTASEQLSRTTLRMLPGAKTITVMSRGYDNKRVLQVPFGGKLVDIPVKRYP